MKKIIFQICLVFIAISALAQENKNMYKYDIIDPATTAGKIFRNPKGGVEKPLGSPYLLNAFSPAKVENVAQNANMRYNVFLDEFEFMTAKNDTLILDKIEDFKTITLIGFNKKYKLTAYTNTKNKMAYGYLIELYEKNGYGLFQKENINFYEGKKAKTSLERDMPSRYAKTDDSYFFKNKELGVSEFPDGKKDLIKLFPDKKAAIEAFVKENKIDFSQRAGMIRIIDFLAAQ